jgi:hypothetical protein
MHCTILSSVTSQAISHFLINDMILGKKVIAHKVCVLIFLQLLSEIFLNFGRIQQDTTTNVHRSPCKVPVILVGLS